MHQLSKYHWDDYCECYGIAFSMYYRSLWKLSDLTALFFTAAVYSSRYPSLSLNGLYYESNYLTLFNTQLLHWSCWSSALLGVIQYIANANWLRVWRGGMHDKGSVTAVLSVQIDPPLRDVQRYIHVVYVTDSTFTERIHYSCNSALHFKANVFHIDVVMLYVLADWG